MSVEFELNESPPTIARGNISCTARDDDLDYSLRSLHLLEQHPNGPTTQQAADAPLAGPSVPMTDTAERVASRNALDGVPVEEASGYRNHYREQIAAQTVRT